MLVSFAGVRLSSMKCPEAFVPPRLGEAEAEVLNWRPVGSVIDFHGVILPSRSKADGGFVAVTDGPLA